MLFCNLGLQITKRVSLIHQRSGKTKCTDRAYLSTYNLSIISIIFKSINAK